MKCFNPDVTREVNLGSKKYIVNDKYYLKNFSDWNEQIRDWQAERERIILLSEHIVVIDFIRKAFEQYKRHTVVRMITAEMSDQFGIEKGTVKHFHNLFPGGIHQAFLIAGLPMQDSCC
jgi:TusE/DsrC/DsvC family sulfur relay protein